MESISVQAALKSPSVHKADRSPLITECAVPVPPDASCESQASVVSFEAYMRKLIKEGYWIEFFIEGGRSRTGKCLPPKLGILANIVDAVKSGAAEDVNLVPVSLGYERVIEEGAYSRELGGGIADITARSQFDELSFGASRNIQIFDKHF